MGVVVVGVGVFCCLSFLGFEGCDLSSILGLEGDARPSLLGRD